MNCSTQVKIKSKEDVSAKLTAAAPSSTITCGNVFSVVSGVDDISSNNAFKHAIATVSSDGGKSEDDKKKLLIKKKKEEDPVVSPSLVSWFDRSESKTRNDK